MTHMMWVGHLPEGGPGCPGGNKGGSSCRCVMQSSSDGSGFEGTRKMGLKKEKEKINGKGKLKVFSDRKYQKYFEK